MYWSQFTIILFIKLLSITGYKLKDVSYYDMPRMYELKDYAYCELQKGVYCYGYFELLPSNNPSMLKALQDFSSFPSVLNHTMVVRGYCLNCTCSHISNGTETERFIECVSQDINRDYNLSTRPVQESYCFTESTADRINNADVAFLLVVSVIVICNIVGTSYDYFTNDNNKRNKYLLAWSMTSNWKHLVNTKRESEGHKALDGVKSILSLTVMHCHVINVYLRSFTSRPEVMENLPRFFSSFYASCTICVHVFTWLSSFLLVNKLSALKSKQTFFVDFIQMLLNRLVRILPVTLFAIALQATWWRHAGTGPIWHSLVTIEANICRKYWWTHLLLINNLWQFEEKCLVQTWFIAADMQVFFALLPLLLLICKLKTLTALKIVTALFCASLSSLFLISYIWNLKPYIYISDIRYIANQWNGVKSFTWLYAAPYTCLPLALGGAWCAFALKHLRDKSIQLTHFKWFHAFHFVSLPLFVAWLSAGHWLRCYTTPLFMAAYFVISHSVFAVLLSILLMGLIHGVRAYNMLSWDIWRISSRMSLAVLVLHMSFCLSIVASTNMESEYSLMTLAIDTVAVWVFTYTAAIPTIILVESPFIQIYNAITRT